MPVPRDSPLFLPHYHPAPFMFYGAVDLLALPVSRRIGARLRLYWFYLYYAFHYYLDLFYPRTFLPCCLAT